jgi:hypothetical protein
MTNSHQQQQQQLKRFIIHVDINKTIIISDSAGGLTIETAVNDIIMASVWGVVNTTALQQCEQLIQDGKLKTFEEIGEYRLKHCWNRINSVPLAHAPQEYDNVMSFYAYMDVVYPYTQVEPTGNAKRDLEKQLASNRRIKRIRRQYMDKFTESGHVGEMFVQYKTELLEKLTVNQSDEYVKLIPAFFNMVLSLEQRRINNEIEYSIIFRTFGDVHDVKNVVAEYNDFCLGRHPRYTNVPPSLRDKAINLQEGSHNLTIGYLYVNSNHKNGSYLIGGSLNRVRLMDGIVDPSVPIDELLHNQKPSRDSVKLFSGVHEIYNTIMEQTKTGACMFYRDYWYWWSANREFSDSGKRFIIDPTDTSVLQIFIDDNVTMPDWPTKGIVSLIDSNTGETIDQKPYLNVLLWDCKPYCAITEETYFENMILQAEQIWKGK